MIDGLLDRWNGDELGPLGHIASGEDAHPASVLLEVSRERRIVELLVRVLSEVGEAAAGRQIHEHRSVAELEVEVEQGDSIDRGGSERDRRVHRERRASDAALAVDEEHDVAATLRGGRAPGRGEPPDQDLDLRREHGHLDRLWGVFGRPLRRIWPDVLWLLW